MMLGRTTIALLLLVEASDPRALTGPEIISAFDGKTVSGAYADGTAFRETYMTDGKINYWDPRGVYFGTWSVTNNLFCTFYEGIDGACFRIEQTGTNCFDFYSAAATSEEALDPKGKPQYTARGSINGQKSTCPDELQA